MPALPSATALGDAAVSAEEEETRTADDNAAEDDSLTTDEVQRLLLLSGQRTHQEVRRLLTDSERRHQQLVEESERRQREQMETFQAQNAQLQARTDQLLEALRVAQTHNAQTSTEPLVEETPFGRRRPRFSTASNLAFGDEDTPLGTSLPHRPLPPHLVPQTPQTTATSRWDDRSPHPRAAKSKEMGIFRPEEGQTAYSWWQGLMQYKSYSKITDTEIFMGLPGCFESGRAKEFFNELKPQPATLEEFRHRLFAYFNRNESLVRSEAFGRQFKPDEEKLEQYLDDKYRLFSELFVSRLSNRGRPGFSFASDSIMTKDTVADVITDVHEGLPETWSLWLDGVRDNAEDWPQYRSAMLAKEHRTRVALKTLGRALVPLAPSPRSSGPHRLTPVATAPATPVPIAFPSQVSRPGQPASQFRRPARTTEEEAVYRLDIKLGRCFNCHTADHAKRDCPRLHSAVNTVRQLLASLETEQDDEVVSHLVRSVGTLMMDTRVSDHTSDLRGLTDDDDDVSRVRRARRVSVSLIDSSHDPFVHVRATKAEQLVELPGRRHRDVVAHKVAVHVGDDNERLELHVDGGSPLSMITSRALRTISPDAEILPPEPLRIKGYRGDESQRPSGVVVLPICFPTSNGTPVVKHQFEFHVVDECTGGWILGVDNMKADGIDALSKRERLVFEHRPDAEVPLLQATSKQTVVGCPNHLVCARRTTISAHTARLVQIDPVTIDRVVQPWWFTPEAPTGFVKVPSCVIGPSTKGIEVFNTSDVDVEFQEGDVLGETTPLRGTLGSVEELGDAILRTRGATVPQLSRSLHEWKKETSEQTIRRVVFTHAEPDGGDVLPELDMPAPKDRLQTVSCSSKLSGDQRARLAKVLEAHAVWPTPRRPLGLYEYGEVSLRLREGQESWTHAEPPRRTSPAQKDVIDETIREHDALGA
ncbi:unnamed protein product [Tilletia laevis]|uniref:CCHC-type domain-containing protein n=1 Tax=Tilletia laevis TaxID=157183 RepID=A0A9N8LWJ5_9BASI|nr:unnamed protein product [Tilletia laevis]